MKSKNVWILAGMLLFLTGCATSRSQLALDIPEMTLNEPNGKQVFVRSVVDNRTFQNKPTTPDVPSLKGDVNTAADDVKKRAVGRKRNGYGKALGDVLIDEGNTVESLIFKATRNSLVSLGYQVTDKKEEARPDAIIMDISVDKFWTWVTLGAWAGGIHGQIMTTDTLEMAGQKGKPLVITGDFENSIQVVTDGTWKNAVQTTLSDYIHRAQTQFKEINENS